MDGKLQWSVSLMRTLTKKNCTCRLTTHSKNALTLQHGSQKQPNKQSVGMMDNNPSQHWKPCMTNHPLMLICLQNPLPIAFSMVLNSSTLSSDSSTHFMNESSRWKKLSNIRKKLSYFNCSSIPASKQKRESNSKKTLTFSLEDMLISSPPFTNFVTTL